jgi:O-antigen/teichoic acid export membrane protein
VHLARILLLGVACLAIATPLAQLFFSEDSPRNVAYSLLAKYVVLAAGTVVLAPHLGPSGAAWAFVGSEAVGLVYAGVIVKRRWAMLVRSADTQRTPHPT